MPVEKPKFHKIFLASIYLIVDRRDRLAKALLVPFLLLFALDAILLAKPPQAITWALEIPKLAVITLYAIMTHRIVLMGTDSVGEWGLRHWTSRETAFVGRLSLISVSYVTVYLAILMKNNIVTALCIFLVIYLDARLSLVFPACAIDQRITFKTSWQLTKNHQALMALIVVLVPILFAVPVIIITKWLPHSFFVTRITHAFMSVFVIANLSLTYGEIARYESHINRVL